MEYDVTNKIIISNKSLNDLDKFTISFINILEKYVDYVIVSGYVSIILGRSRASEDVDFLIPEMEYSKFEELFNDLLINKFECANTTIIKEAYEMLDEHAIRFYKNTPIPNIEFKKISDNIHKDAFSNKIKVKLKEKTLFVSPLELQIAYKLSIMANGDIEEIHSDKDFEDAKHIYEIFKEKLDMDKLNKYVKLFNIEDKFEFIKK